MEDEASHSQTELIERRGNVKFLNGGLFDLESEYDVQRDDKMKLGVTIPNAAFAKVLDLFERYNFTVAESTPLDVEVAVDPEMLGKVFEELVTGRHESGSYYTPRPIVSFMCREALKYYLQPTVADEAAVAKFVDDGDPAGLTAPETVLAALKRVRVCDPACGSGAYLLGMMQELLRLREALFAAHAKDHKSIYDRKLEIIQNNLYGVDLDEFAVNIAKLRLWLSLAVDYTGSKPEPLPNLDFKIERGDSLTAPDPQSVSDLFRSTIDMFSKELTDLKGKFIKSSGTEKKKQAAQIREIEAKLRANLLDNCPPGAIDWRVAFAEVFDEGGFDIALENPPYVRMELFKNDKPTLKKNFPAVYDGSADLYVYFFARTHQILKPGGVACVITTNKWLKAGYAEGLRRFFSESAWVSAVVDFGHAKQIFQSADVFPSIAVFRKPSFAEAPLISRICAIPRDELDLENVGDQIHETSFEMPRNHFAGNAWTLELPATLAILEKIKQAGVPLHEFVGAGPLYGIKTGCNEAFIVDTPTRTKLVSAHASSEAVLRKYLRGQDVDRWVSTWSGEWMIFAVRGIKIDAYPAIKKHLQQFRDKLEPKPSGFEGKWNGRASGNNKWYGRVPKKGCWQTRVVIP